MMRTYKSKSAKNHAFKKVGTVEMESEPSTRNRTDFEYTQKDVDLEFIDSYRSKGKGSSYTEIPNIRIDVYPELNKVFIVSMKNKLFLEIKPTDEIITEGFKIEKVRILGTCIYMLASRIDENENHKRVVIQKGINVNSLKFDKHTNCIVKAA